VTDFMFYAANNGQDHCFSQSEQIVNYITIS